MLIFVCLFVYIISKAVEQRLTRDGEYSRMDKEGVGFAPRTGR